MIFRETINGVELIGEQHGSGVPLVFVHGYTTTRQFWRNQIPEFARDYTVICYDQRGHGESEKPTDAPYSIQQFSDDLARLLQRRAREPAVLVGLSMGGMIVQQCLLDHPANVRALVLVGTTAHGFGPAVRAENVLRRIDQIGMGPAAEEVIVKSFPPSVDDELLEFARREVQSCPRHVGEAAVRSIEEFDSRPFLARIQVPTLIVVGSEDEISPPITAEELHSGISTSTLVVIPGCGHFPMIEHPEAFNHVLRDFLHQHDI